jgi:hypothetical protein
MNRNTTLIVIILAILALCCCLAVVAVGGIGLLSWNIQAPRAPIEVPQVTLELRRPTRLPATAAPRRTPAPGETDTPATEPSPNADLDPAAAYRALLEAEVPIGDMIDQAHRLAGVPRIEPTVAPNPPAGLEARQQFWLINGDTNEPFQVEAVLRYLGQHSYIWVEDGIQYNPKDLQKLGDTFESQILPTNRAFFGTEWTPGVDGDPRIYILYARNLGRNIAGYYSSADEVPAPASKNSNAHEMFLFNADTVSLDEEYVYGTLAHEFQHMIHFNIDRNEDLWLNEGFSELAMHINGYDAGGHDWSFAQNPDMQLTVWAGGDADTSPNYGAAYLFTTYFLNRFGEDLTKGLMASPENGLQGIDSFLASAGINGSGSTPLTADQLFADWTVANYLNDPMVDGNRFFYANYPGVPHFDATETVSDCPTDQKVRDVNQYGTDYIRITCRGDFTLHFEGSTEVPALPTDPYSGAYYVWSNQGDESDMTLTRSFDFRGQSGALNLSYWTWYDLEQDYDYLYLTASADGGETWDILTTPGGTAADPTGANFGWGYTGASSGWVEETVDLSAYAGENVILRFEYITDAAVNGVGLVLDDIRIPEVDYAADFEAGWDGWEAAGWVRLHNALPQQFAVSLIQFGGASTSVQSIVLDATGAADIPLSIQNANRGAVLVVSGTTRFTRQPATYAFEVKR